MNFELNARCRIKFKLKVMVKSTNCSKLQNSPLQFFLFHQKIIFHVYLFYSGIGKWQSAQHYCILCEAKKLREATTFQELAEALTAFSAASSRSSAVISVIPLSYKIDTVDSTSWKYSSIL